MRQVNPDIEILSNYANTTTPVLCRCKQDGNEWYAKPHSLLAGHGCPQCAARRQNRRSHDDFAREMALKHPSIKILSEFHGSGAKVKFECSVCGYQWEAVANGLLTHPRSGCPKCLHKAPVSEVEFIERLSSANFSVIYLGGYAEMERKATFECAKCGRTWNAIAANVLKGRSCPKCKKSHGEQAVASYLSRHHISYINEYKFDDCRNQRPLPFDFYIPDYNMCIEYDGQQHSDVAAHWQRDDAYAQLRLEYVKHNDSIKTEYCAAHNIPIIRIPYTEFNKIDEILDKVFP